MKSWILFIFCCVQSAFCLAQLRPAAFAANANEAPVFVQNATIVNSAEIDFSPAYLGQGIVFPSARKIGGSQDAKIKSSFFELFYSDLDPNDNPLRPSSFSPEINSVVHEGPVTFSANGQRIFFTRNTSKKGVKKADKDGVTRLQIFTASKGIFDWENITPLPFNADHFSCVHPTWNENEKRLYFSSNMLDGHGGYDLYYSAYKDSSWSDPVNLGDKINTEEDELFPFYHPNGQLFFASDGYQGLGGLDMYMISFSGQDHRVINLGDPFNSELDDLGIILNKEGTKGFFASNRTGGKGRDDIYQFQAPNGIDGRTLPPNIEFPLLVLNEESSAIVPGAAIRIFEKRGDQYFQKDKSLFEAVLLPQAEGSTQLVFKTLRNDPRDLGVPDANSDQFGKATIPLLGFREYKLLVHAEGFETKEFGLTTAAETNPDRVQIALQPKNCLTIKGGIYSALTNGPIPHSLINIKSKLTGQEEIILSNSLGRYEACLNFGDSYTLTVYKEKFEALSAIIRPDDFAGQRNKQVDFKLKPDRSAYGPGTVIVLENIYYDFAKYQIRAGAALELEELAQLMRIYPSMEVKLEAHTDSRGENRFNRKLSEKRAKAAKQYLAARGIQPYRMSTAGLGETRLRNGCSNGKRCSELEHQYNRRTEVIITRMDDPVPVRYQLNRPETVGGK